MRRIERIPVLPPTLAPDGPGGRKAAKNRTIKAADPGRRLNFPKYWNNPDVRGALYAQHGKVCAYCGRHLPGNDRGDVEHFRPKGNVAEDPEHGGYWWLAYDLTNYLLSCSLCNRNRKKDRFPLRPRARHIRFENRVRLSREARILLDPAIDPVEQLLRVEWWRTLCLIRARNHLSRIHRLQVEKMLDFFHINSDVTLLRARNEIRNEVNELLANDLDDEARKMAIRYRPHGLVAKQILEARAPHLLPGPEEELQWLLDDIQEDLLYTLQLMEGEVDDAVKRQAEELLWSLAVLWKAPPAGEPAGIEEFLVQLGVKAYVEERFREL
ncbi:MAG: hypothetical protein GY859_00280 [Desulfobacterales bacterium]|nr:hypothetical protein [Desulfobacterales bacterium]